MQFDIITIFPEFFAGPLDCGIVRRAREARIVDVRVHDLRAFTHDKHHVVDDRPFGGGEGMVLKPEPLFGAVEALTEDGGVASPPPGGRGPRTAVVLLSASGKLFHQETARRFAQLDRILLLCGRYEGVDERVAEHLATDELSVGDFVLSGGELGAALIMDTVTRLLPGALGNEDSAVNESFSVLQSDSAEVVPTSHQFPVSAPPQRATPGKPVTGPTLLDFPHYTRPADFRGWKVPKILLRGNHEEIRRWRREQALEKTRRNRPDLLAESGV